MKPIRIQRKRQKGWHMPDNTVYVGRGSRWGNPYFLDGALVKLKGPNGQVWIEGGGDITTVIASYMAYLLRTGLAAEVSKLRGKNLACWCKDGSPCHADVLLEMANS